MEDYNFIVYVLETYGSDALIAAGGGYLLFNVSKKLDAIKEMINELKHGSD